MYKIKLCTFLLASVLSACKVQVDVPQGGHVVSVNGGFECSSGQSCEIEVKSTDFEAAYVAIPDEGHRFSGWRKKDRGIFGGSENPEVRISTAQFEGNEVLMSFLSSDEIFYLEPSFERLGPSGIRPGGEPGGSVFLNRPGKNEISSNSFYNYFKFTAKKGETLVIHTDLSLPLTDQEKSRCSSNPGTGTSPSSYDTAMNVYDKKLDRVTGICGENLTVKFETGGTYYVQFDYPENGTGLAYATSILGDSAINSPTGLLGAVSNPKPILLRSANRLNQENYLNYYRYTAQEGERIILNVNLNLPMTSQQKNRCSSAGDFPSTSYDTRVYIYDSTLTPVGGVCGEELRFDFPWAGTYLFHFRYGNQSAGFFNAAAVN